MDVSRLDDISKLDDSVEHVASFANLYEEQPPPVPRT